MSECQLKLMDEMKTSHFVHFSSFVASLRQSSSEQNPDVHTKLAEKMTFRSLAAVCLLCTYIIATLGQLFGHFTSWQVQSLVQICIHAFVCYDQAYDEIVSVT
jgi:cAMP phosphodiesterase